MFHPDSTENTGRNDTPSFREHFGKFADKYGFKGAFSGMMHRFSTRNEHWGYVATFLDLFFRINLYKLCILISR